MLSKLFSNLKFGLSIWLILFSLALWSLTYYLNCADCFAKFNTSDWIEASSVFIILMASLFLNSSIFNTLFRVTRNNNYSPLFLAIFISWTTVLFHWEMAFEVLLIALFYLNTYNIFNGKDENQIGFHLTAGLLSLFLTWLTPIGNLCHIWHRLSNLCHIWHRLSAVLIYSITSPFSAQIEATNRFPTLFYPIVHTIKGFVPPKLALQQGYQMHHGVSMIHHGVSMTSSPLSYAKSNTHTWSSCDIIRSTSYALVVCRPR